MGMDGGQPVLRALRISDYVHPAAAGGRSGRVESVLCAAHAADFPAVFSRAAGLFRCIRGVGTPQPAKTVLLYVTFLQAFIPPLITHLIVVPHPDWVVMGLRRAVVALRRGILLRSVGAGGCVHARASTNAVRDSRAGSVADAVDTLFLSRSQGRAGAFHRANGFARRRVPGGDPMAGSRQRMAGMEFEAARDGSMDVSPLWLGWPSGLISPRELPRETFLIREFSMPPITPLCGWRGRYGWW